MNYIIPVDDKTETVQIRVTALEKAAFLQAAGLSGIPLSGWVRERLRKASRLELESAGLAIPFVQSQTATEE
jgi:hypothetical protein